MAIILIHLRRILLLFTVIYLSGILLKRLFYARLGENTQKIRLNLSKKSRTHHLRSWCYIYAIYSYIVLLSVINWSELLRISFSLMWKKNFLQLSYMFHVHSLIFRDGDDDGSRSNFKIIIIHIFIVIVFIWFFLCDTYTTHHFLHQMVGKFFIKKIKIKKMRTINFWVKKCFL